MVSLSLRPRITKRKKTLLCAPFILLAILCLLLLLLSFFIPPLHIPAVILYTTASTPHHPSITPNQLSTHLAFPHLISSTSPRLYLVRVSLPLLVFLSLFWVLCGACGSRRGKPIDISIVLPLRTRGKSNQIILRCEKTMQRMQLRRQRDRFGAARDTECKYVCG